MIYDVIIIWAWASWLFAWINLPKNMSKLILEKNKFAWAKILLSWWERANVSNINIDPLKDYFGQNKKALLSVFKRYNQWDLQSFFAEHWINIAEEDRWRLILESWNSKELLNFLLKKTKDNNCEIKYSSEVLDISKKDSLFQIKTSYSILKAKNVIVSSWWKSFFQVWTTWDAFNFAEKFWLKIIPPHRGLCWLVTKTNFSSLSWISQKVEMKLLHDKKLIYSESWPLLFTHFWVSWPVVFNISIALWEYLNKLKINLEEEKIKYIKNNIKISVKISEENQTKKLKQYFEKNSISSFEVKGSTWSEAEGDGFWKIIISWLQDWRSWKEAKVTWWWIDINELDNNLMSKKNSWLYFIWECVDITWKTWGYNLQWAWSSAYVCSKNI